MSTVSSSPERKAFPVLTPDSHRGGRGTPGSANKHPYAIKTTSTALLTRSSSSGFVASHQHHYIPTTPSPSPSKHRHSKSDLSRPSPRPLPIPPSFESPSKPVKAAVADDQVFSNRARAETLPTLPNPPFPSPVKVDDLPSNPRVWSTSQLASYLITALRVRSGEALPLPLPVAKDVASFVRQERLTGRAFLRLNEQDLEHMEVNNLWRDALLNAARNLRANVLKGRIWGFDADAANEASPIYPFRNRYNSSSSSVDDLAGSEEVTPQKDELCKGRVRRAIASLERTSSTGSGSGFSNRGSSTSDGEVAYGAFSDEEASFASGSEASEVEERMARIITKKRILPQPLVERSAAEATKDEPSVAELLEADPLSKSWGAKAWEDMTLGETVKYVGSERASDQIASPVESVAVAEVKGVNFLRTGDARAQINDIFSKSLPARPLPSPPKSGAASPISGRLITGLPIEIVEKVNRSVQVDWNPPTTPVSAGLIDISETTIDESKRQELEDALVLLEMYKKRLQEAEARILTLEQQQPDGSKTDYVSQSVETEFIADSHVDVDGSTVSTAPCASTHLTVDGHAGCETVGDSEATRDDDYGQLPAPRNFDISEWRSYIKRPEWDPLENGVPTYVLMVGVGVCVVVLSTIVKRLVGRKA